jgi:hypothetical protein
MYENPSPVYEPGTPAAHPEVKDEEPFYIHCRIQEAKDCMEEGPCTPMKGTTAPALMAAKNNSAQVTIDLTVDQ